jgi:hypothetical protein
MEANLVACYYSFGVQQCICCIIHVRYEYSFSQAALDERRNNCASTYIMYGYRAYYLGMADSEVRPDTENCETYQRVSIPG